MVNFKANKVEVRLPAKKNVEILAAVSDLIDGPGAIIEHDEVRKVAGKESCVASFLPQLKPFVRQLWASLFKHSETKSILCTSDKYGLHSRGCGGSMNINVAS